MAKKAPADPPQRHPVETLREKAGTPDWLFAAAKQKHGWPVGAELTQVDYEAAIKAAGNEVIR